MIKRNHNQANNTAWVVAGLLALLCVIAMAALVSFSAQAPAAETQTTVTIGWLQQVYDFIRKYQAEVALTWCLTGNPMLTFFLVQKIKRVLPAILKRRLETWEIMLLSYPVLWALTWLTWWGLTPELNGRYFIVAGVVASILLDRMVSGIMRWAKAHRPALYIWLRNDRRSPARGGLQDNGDLTEYFGATEFTEEKTEPKK